MYRGKGWRWFLSPLLCIVRNHTPYGSVSSCCSVPWYYCNGKVALERRAPWDKVRVGVRGSESPARQVSNEAWSCLCSFSVLSSLMPLRPLQLTLDRVRGRREGGSQCWSKEDRWMVDAGLLLAACSIASCFFASASISIPTCCPSDLSPPSPPFSRPGPRARGRTAAVPLLSLCLSLPIAHPPALVGGAPYRRGARTNWLQQRFVTGRAVAYRSHRAACQTEVQSCEPATGDLRLNRCCNTVGARGTVRGVSPGRENRPSFLAPRYCCISLCLSVCWCGRVAVWSVQCPI
jgi:hypothetical protein